MEAETYHPAFSKHADVMNADPKSEQEKQNLVDELKSRGNYCFKAKGFEEAEMLYSRAIHHMPKEVAILGNRSAARCSMGKLELALEDAIQCITLDPSWVKGYFRKGQALKRMDRYGEAYVAFKKVVEMEPSNKGAVKQLEESKASAEKLGQDLTGKVQAPKVVAKKPAASSPVKKPLIQKPSKSSTVVTEEELGENVRGYKKLADGRTTTYFNNELTEEAKKLIGDIAPKKIENAQAVQIKNVQGGSAWNQGSTFEEKDMGEWAKKHVVELLKSASFEKQNGPEEPTTVSVVNVKDIEGDASIAVFRGKKRYLFDFTFTVECKGEFGDVSPSSVTGQLNYLDFSSDCDGDYDVDVLVSSRYQSEAGKLMYEHLSKAQTGLRAVITEKLNQFVQNYAKM